MLESTFLHIPGLTVANEAALWQAGCLSWRDLSEGLDRFSYGDVERSVVKRTLDKSYKSLEKRDGAFFKKGLGLKEAWRAYPEFKDSCLYLDIETDGGRSGASVTTIGMFDGVEFKCLIKGQDLDEFPSIASQYGMLVTFFGANFDLPMLEKRFPGIRFKQLHLDLCPTLHRLGLRGGLKKIEKQLGIERGDDTDGLGGLDAIRLWRRYTLLGDDQALETLIAYNREDVVNMEYLAGYAYQHLRDLTFPASQTV
ncbi:MAG: ribonuclease H-like domain-containing protein [Fimbriimonas sp.]|nr:ribonuclease H-like domain-containing protein [Fimbriimonas sp.]